MELTKRLIFAPSPGRCGTGYLYKLAGCIPGVHAEHEGQPDFVHYARLARQDPDVATNFWLKEKLPAIEETEGDVYFETSHLFAKGYVGPLLALGVVPDAVLITRDPREVALSMWRRGSIPGRTRRAQMYQIAPVEPCHLPLENWEMLTDYQLCYWAFFETMARCTYASQAIRDAGGKVVAMQFQGLVSGTAFEHMVKALELPAPDQDAVARVRAEGAYNATVGNRAGKFPEDEDLNESEQEVLKLLEPSEGGQRKVTAQVPQRRPKVDVVILNMGWVRWEVMMTTLNMVHDKRFNLTIACNRSTPTAGNRSKIVKEFLENPRQADWLIMIDDDNPPRGNPLDLISEDRDVIVLPTPSWKGRAMPEHGLVWNINLTEEQMFEPFLPNPAEHGPFYPIRSAGTGFIIIRREVLQAFIDAGEPPFQDEFDDWGVRSYGHDMRFTRRAREVYGFRVEAALEVPCGHIKELDLYQMMTLHNRRLKEMVEEIEENLRAEYEQRLQAGEGEEQEESALD